MNKAFKIIVAVLLLVSVVCGVFTRLSYSDDISNPEIQAKARVSQISHYDPVKYETIMEELSEASIIIKATALDEYSFENKATKGKLKVTEVYKGDISEGEVINYYMSGFFNKNDNKVNYRAYSYFNHMIPGKEYYVFGYHGNFGDLYEEKYGKTYTYISIEMSWFLTEFTSPEILDENKEYTYEEIKDNEFNCFSIEQRDQLNELKEEIINKFIK